MSFDISYIFEAKNRYSSVARKINRDNEKLRSSVNKTKRSFDKKNSSLRKTQAALLKARRRLREYRRESEKAAKSNNSFLSTLKGFAATAIVGVGIAKLVEEGSKLEDAFADLSAITGATGSDLEFLKGEVNALSIESKTMPADVATAFKAVASAKSELLEDPGGLSEVTKQVLLLKNAAGIDMAQAVDTVTSALNQFGAGADQAARFVNVLAAGSKVGASEVFETKEAVINAGVAANLAGLSFESFNSLIQVMAKNGIKGARAGSELNALLLKMEGTMGKFAPSVIGINKSLQFLKDANLDAGQSMKLFGLESVDALDILTKNVPLVKEWTKEITGTSSAQEQASKRLATFSSRLKAAKVRLVNLSAGIFNQARPALGSLGESVTDFLDSLDESDIEVFGIALSGLARSTQIAFEAFSIAFKGIMNVVKPVAAIIKGLTETVAQLLAALFSFDFSNFDLSGAFDIGGRFLGIGERVKDEDVKIELLADIAEAKDQEAKLKLLSEVTDIKDQEAKLKFITEIDKITGDEILDEKKRLKVLVDIEKAEIKESDSLLKKEVITFTPEQQRVLREKIAQREDIEASQISGLKEDVSAIQQARPSAQVVDINTARNQIAAVNASANNQPLNNLQPEGEVSANENVSTINSNISVNGQINVSASGGAKVDSVESSSNFQGASGNIGIGATG